MRPWSRISERGLALLRDRESGGFLAVAALIGVAVGLGAVLLIRALSLMGEAFGWAADRLDEQSWIFLLTVPLGIVVSWWIARAFAPEVAGDGVPEATAALQVRGGYMSTRSIPLKILATALTLGGGASAGREGPIVQIGGAIGSSISRRFLLGEDQVRSLVAAGAGAGIGAAFNAPIAGMLFALEVILGSFAVRHMSAIVIASVAAAVTSRSLLRPEEFVTADAYELEAFSELWLYLVLALVIVAGAWLFLRMVAVIEERAERLPRPAWLRPVLLGLVVGGIVMVEPAVAGDGQEFVSRLLEDLDLQEDIQRNLPTFEVVTWWALGLVALAKLAATALTISSGGSGGAFTPSLFIGASLGAAFAELVSPFWGASELDPGAFAVVGMAAFFAAVARAPLTSILLVFEVTQAREYGLILPLMLATVVATFLADRFHPHSIYTMPLARRGIRLVRTSEVDLLDTVTVGEVMVQPAAVAHPEMPLSEADELMDRHRYHGLAVIDDGRLVGIITVSDIVRAGGPSPHRRVREAMTIRPVTVGPESHVSHAMERMAVLGVGRLPVVADEDSTRMVGMFRREDAVRAYHQALGATTDHYLVRERLRQRTEPGAHYFDFRIPPGSVADGRAVGEVAWPEGCTLVAVRRGTEVMVPRGATRLESGDVVTAFGTEEARRRVIDRLNEGADEPTAEISIEELTTEPDRGDGQR